MKKLSLAVIAAVTFASMIPAAQAAAAGASAYSPFNVVINLTSACKIGSIGDVIFSYAALGPAVSSTGGTFTLQCTEGLPAPTLGLLAGSVSTGTGTSTLAVTDSVVNLAYTLTAPTVIAPTGLALTYSIAGSIASGLAGKCATGGASCDNTGSTNKINTLVVAY